MAKRADGLLDFREDEGKLKITDGDRTYIIDGRLVQLSEDYIESVKQIRDLRFNKRTFRYPGGYYKDQLCNLQKFRVLFEKESNPLKNPYLPEEDKKVDYWNGDPGEIRRHNLYRAKRKVEDLVLLNESLGWWVTLTFNDEKASASDLKKVKSKTRYWLQNNVSRKDLAFVLVPEYHPRSKDRVHWHGLMNDSKLEFVDSGTRTVDGFDKPLKLETIRRLHVENQVRDVVYNIKDWTLGFSTAIRITGERPQLAAYLTKYMTKDECAAAEKIFGKRYWSSKNLERTPQIELADVGYREWCAHHDAPIYGFGKYLYMFIDHTGEIKE